MEQGAVRQGTYMAPSKLKDFHMTVRRKQGSQSYNHKELTSANKLNEKEAGLSLELPGRNSACRHPDFKTVRPMPDF